MEMIRSKTEQKKDLSTLNTFLKKVLPLGDNFSNFKSNQDPSPCTYIGFGANAIYTAEINIPKMSDAEKMKAGIRVSKIMGMIWITSEIWPHNEQGPDMNKTVRTYTIHAEFKAEGRYTARRWENKVFAKFHDYSTEVDAIVESFRHWIMTEFKPIEKSIADKTYRWDK